MTTVDGSYNILLAGNITKASVAQRTTTVLCCGCEWVRSRAVVASLLPNLRAEHSLEESHKQIPGRIIVLFVEGIELLMLYPNLLYI